MIKSTLIGLLAVTAALSAAPAQATTIAPTPLSTLDPLGTGCVDGGGVDDPFPAAKGVRAPAFCVTDPCAGALTRDELAFDVVGRPVSDAEWGLYYSRYAEACRAETFIPGAPPPSPRAIFAGLAPARGIATTLPRPAPAGTQLTPTAGAGLLALPLLPFAFGGSSNDADAPEVAADFGGGNPGGLAPDIGTFTGGENGDDSPDVDTDTGGPIFPPPTGGPDRPTFPPPPPPPPVVPLPLSGLLLLSALGAGVLVKRPV